MYIGCNKTQTEVRFLWQPTNFSKSLSKGNKAILARIVSEVVGAVKWQYNEETINDSEEDLPNMCNHHGLWINNTFLPHKFNTKFKWSNSRC